MNQYALYLRKSRADLDAEARSENETLSKHRAALTAYAKQRGLFIAREYAEIVSGDTIAARPQMQALLNDIKAGLYAGVIVNDLDRLGRGDSIDQEIIKYTFAASNCLIITPTRDIDPSSQTDQDTLDFSMFLARCEYRKIKQRMQEGRVRSAASGNWIQSIPPYGYDIKHEVNKLFLVPNSEESNIVKMIYDMHISENIGAYAIANKLTELGIRSRSNKVFHPIVVRRILSNPVYTGCIIYGRTKNVNVINADGTRAKKKVKSEPIIIENAHEPIIPKNVFDSMQKEKALAPVNIRYAMHNPLCSIIHCSKCGKAMKLATNSSRTVMLKCWTPKCPTSGKALHIVEEAVLDTLKSWCAEYHEPTQQEQLPIVDDTYIALKKQLESIESQYKRAQELVELGVYTVAEFIQRRDTINAQKALIIAEINKRLAPSKTVTITRNIPQIKKVLDAYPYAQTVEEKNRLLKSVISDIIYTKTERNGELTLDIIPLIQI